MTDRSKRIKWRASQKFNHLMNSQTLKDSELGAYLRKHGLYSTDLTTWKEEAYHAFDGARPMRNEEKKRLEMRVQFLEKELEKAKLKIELQKKVQELNQKYDEEEKQNSKEDLTSSSLLKNSPTED